MSTHISVSVSGSVACVARHDGKRIAQHLTYPEVVHREQCGVIHGRRQWATLGRFENETFRFPAKLLPHLARVLRQEGIHLDYSKCRFVRHKPDTKVLGTLPQPLQGVMSHPSFHFGGIIPTSPETRAERLIPSLLKLYPDAKAALAVRGEREIRAWEARLADVGLQQEVTTTRRLCRGGWLGTPKVHLMTYQWLDQSHRDDVELVIVPDAVALRDNDRWTDVARLDPVPRDYSLLRDPKTPAFGFVRVDQMQSRGEVMRLKALFGQVIPVATLPP